ncbi:MAG: hypothetical protein AAGE86_01570 [Pseudomonadota bacterium]
MEWLTVVANVSAIATAVVAAGAAIWVWFDQHSKRSRLEAYLKSEKQAGADKGQRSVLNIMAALGLTEAEVLQASFRSTKIKRRIVSDETGLAAHMLLEYFE